MRKIGTIDEQLKLIDDEKYTNPTLTIERIKNLTYEMRVHAEACESKELSRFAVLVRAALLLTAEQWMSNDENSYWNVRFWVASLWFAYRALLDDYEQYVKRQERKDNE